jgi:hypothetical protein
MSVKLEDYIRYIQKYKQRYPGWAPTFPILANQFGLSFEEIGILNEICAKAGYSPLLRPLAPVCEENWWELISGQEGTFTNPASLYHAISGTEVEVHGISVEASGKVVIILQREDKLAGFSVNQRGRGKWPHYFMEIIDHLSEKNRMMAGVLSGAWFPDPS